MENGIKRLLHMRHKRILCIIFAVTLSACAAQKEVLNEDIVNPYSQSSFATNIPAAISEDGIYYVPDYQNTLYFAENDGTSYPLTSLVFLDGEPADPGYVDVIEFDQYYDQCMLGSPIVYYDDKVLYLSLYENIEGEQKYRLNAVVKDGSGWKTILELTFEPYFFMICDAYIVVSERDSYGTGGDIHVFDFSGKELALITNDESVMNLYVGDGNGYVRTMENLYRISFSDMTLEKVNQEEGVYLFVNDGKAAYYTYPENFEETDDWSLLPIHAGIMDLESGQEVLGLEDCIIDYFDENYIYAVKLKEEHSRFLVMDWQGNVVSEIVPYESLGESAVTQLVIMQEEDFGDIVRVWNGKLFGAAVGDDSLMHMFTCDMDSASCRYLE